MVAVTARNSTSRSLLAGFMLVIAAPVAALVWLGLQLVEQDRQLGVQRLAERRELAASRAVSALERLLAEAERRLADGAAPGQGAVRLSVRGDQVAANPPDGIAYYPVQQPLPEAAAIAFHSAEDLEFRQADLSRAAEALRPLADASDTAVRAGALMRLARVLRKTGRPEEAYRVYGEMIRCGNAAAEGVPADLVGRRARIGLLRELGRGDEAGRDSAALQADLQAGRWRLDRATYLHVAERPPEKGREALSEAAGWLWSRQKQLQPAGRTSVSVGGIPVLLLWRGDTNGIVALAALPEYQRSEFSSRLGEDSGPVLLTTPAGETVFGPARVADGRRTQRLASETGLPWNLTVGDAPGSGSESNQRRNLIVAGLAAILAVLGAGAYFIARALAREMAVMRLQSDFVAAVSHEFRTPLTSMRQFTELLMQENEPPADKRQAFYKAQMRSTDRLHRLVESLLDFGRMEAGRHPYVLQSVDAADLVGGVVEDFRNEAGPRGFAVDWHSPAEPMRIQADPDALSRALWNLLDNAAKYSGESRWIGVEVERSNGRALIRVSDRGLGIPAADRSRIFEKFVRGARAAEDGIKGTGIGLAMVRHIADAHQGRIEVESEPGRGSTFTISIPAED
jgi:pentatricopeptide repeat protein